MMAESEPTAGEESVEPDNASTSRPSFSMAHALSLVRRRQEDRERVRQEEERALEEEKKEKAKAKRKRRRQNQKLAKAKVRAQAGDDSQPSVEDESSGGPNDDESLTDPQTNHASNKRSIDQVEDSDGDTSTTKPAAKRRKRRRKAKPVPGASDSGESFPNSETPKQQPQAKVNLLIPRALMLKMKKSDSNK